MLRWTPSHRLIPIAVLAFALWLPSSQALAQADPQPQAKPQAGEKTAAAEERAKETRHFLPALLHNLGDAKSKYWAAHI